MTWQKERSYRAGELHFHLWGVGNAPRDEAAPQHDAAWYRERFERLATRHARHA